MRVSFNPKIQQPKFTAVNQKFLNEAKSQITMTQNVTNDLRDRILMEIFFLEKMSAEDGIDTLNAIKKLMGKVDWAIEQDLNYLKNYLKNLNKG